MSNRLSLLHCLFCDQIIYGYQELMNHVEFHQTHQQKEIYTVQGSNVLSLPLSKRSELIQHARTMRNKRADSQSQPPSLFHPRWVRGNGSDTDVHVNQQLPLSLPLPPPPSDRMSTHQIYTVQGSNILSLPLSKPSESIQHVRTMKNKRANSQSQPQPPSLFHPRWVRGNGSDTDVHVNQQLPLSLPLPPPPSDRMSTNLSLVHCPLCDESIWSYQEFMNHVLSHPIDYEMEIDVVEGSNSQGESLPKSSELVQHIRTRRNKRPNSQSPLSPLLVHPRWVRGEDSDTNMHVNKQLPLSLPPPPSSYDARFIRGNNDGRRVHTNLELPPPPPSYCASSIRGNDDGRSVHTNQQLPLPPSLYRPFSTRGNDNDTGLQANQLQQMPQPTRRTYVRDSNSIVIDLNEIPPEFEGPHIKEIYFPILDRSDPSQLKFKPQAICDNETSEVDLSLKL